MLPSAETLFLKLSARLRRFILSRVEDEATADELLQEVFLRIHTRIATLQESDRLEAWVYQIARNAIIDHYRARRPTEPLEDSISEALPDPTDYHPMPDAAEELAQSIRALVDELPEPYREALILTEFEGLTQKELASRLGISLPGAKSRVQRGREKIKEQLLNCCHFEFDRYGQVIDYYAHCCCCALPDK